MSGPKTERYLRALEEHIPGETLWERSDRISDLAAELFDGELCRCSHPGEEHDLGLRCGHVACGCLMFREREAQ